MLIPNLTSDTESSAKSTRENLLRKRSSCMYLYVFQRDFQPRRASTTLKKLQRMPWRRKTNEKNLITRSQVDLFSSCRCLKQASVFRCCAVRTSCESWINEMSSNLLRYQCELGAQWAIGATRCDDKCANTILLVSTTVCTRW